MPTIGSRRHASMALDIHNGTYRDSEWSSIGGGSMRSVYLHQPTGVVYKVETWADADYGNVAEWRNAKALRRLAWERVYIPMVSLYNLDGGPVLAMEYVEGKMGSRVARDFGKDARVEIFHKARFVDMHGDNFMFRADGTLVPVDMGSNRLRSVLSTNDEGDEVDRRVLSCGDGSCWGID